MYLAKVIGTVVSTTKHENLVGKKILLTRAVDSDGNYYGKQMISIDYVGAGAGDTVIVATGSAASRCFENNGASIDSTIVAIVDSCEITK